jgi:hypothetical protein
LVLSAFEFLYGHLLDESGGGGQGVKADSTFTTVDVVFSFPFVV